MTKNEEKPFVVKLNKQDITVLGTTFNVQAYENESYSVVTLLSGRIMLEAFNEFSESTGRMFMKPNQCALADNESGSISLSEVNASLTNAWINGEYKFKDEPLSSIVKRLENFMMYGSIWMILVWNRSGIPGRFRWIRIFWTCSVLLITRNSLFSNG